MFFHANTIKKGQKNAKLWRSCQTPFFHAKPLENASLAILLTTTHRPLSSSSRQPVHWRARDSHVPGTWGHCRQCRALERTESEYVTGCMLPRSGRVLVLAPHLRHSKLKMSVLFRVYKSRSRLQASSELSSWGMGVSLLGCGHLSSVYQIADIFLDAWLRFQ